MTTPVSRGAWLYFQASIIVTFLAGSAAPTPLYSVYQAAWGFSSITVTVIFGIYALAVLATLLTLGSLSDYIGRKPVLFVTTLLQAAAMFLFAQAQSVADLIIGRVVQGIATGAAASAIGAAMLDIDRQRGTLANAVGPLTGTALGGVVSGLFVQYFPAPTQLVYAVLGAVFVLQAIALTVMPETSPRKAGALASLRPRFQLPAAVRQPLFVAAPVLIAAWALAGLYGALGPILVRKMLGSESHALGGLVLLVVAGSGALTVLLMHASQARTMLLFGAVALIAGASISVIAIEQRSVVAFFVGSAIGGMGFGTGFQGAIRTVVPLAAAHERAGVLSIVYVIAYLAMGLPAIIGGFGVVYGGGLLATAQEYGWAVIMLSAVALVGTFGHRPAQLAMTSSRQR
ncbi:MAG TPA: MFS transporter [Polyangiales bacterium]|nr:MFS transporter [Polyangiales bacterium]